MCILNMPESNRISMIHLPHQSQTRPKCWSQSILIKASYDLECEKATLRSACAHCSRSLDLRQKMGGSNREIKSRGRMMMDKDLPLVVALKHVTCEL
jgi:hypothetical protein